MTDEPIWCWCGFCRKGQHDKCKAFKGAHKAMHPEYGPIQPEEYCQCSCDPTQPKVPGQGQAREWPALVAQHTYSPLCDGIHEPGPCP